METNLEGQLARLPDGQRVRIETVHADDYASVRRIDGKREGTIAICQLKTLEVVVTSADSIYHQSIRQ